MIYDQLFTSTIDGKLYYVVNIGGIVKYFQKWQSVYRYMRKLGYKYDNGGWNKVLKSKDEIWLEQKFKKE